MTVTRRRLIASLTALPFVPAAGLAAGDVIDLTWNDLIPEGEEITGLDRLRDLGVVQHEQLSTGFVQPEAVGVTDAYDGRMVRLPGFIVPLDFEATGITAFILAPFVGACIHVPPPPANQLVFVTTETPYESAGLFEAVYVTGMFGAAATGTQLAEVGYALTAERIEPYD
ncbi:DUF3299 domain-containing protein [Psychromarinibacter sp. S121]|uniref:DUF3299 domain-containing protein n=1 Tax=Psychromarinibacter sp. S121 TaxID=3415127 RepID=UPI003C7D5944